MAEGITNDELTTKATQNSVTCSKLVSLSGEIRNYKNSGLHYLKLLQIQFNLTLTWDSRMRYCVTTEIKFKVIITPNEKIDVYMDQTRQTEITDDFYIKLLYCKPNHSSLLFTMVALLSPFDSVVWISIVSTLFVLLFLRMYPIRSKKIVHRVWYIYRILMDQDVDVKNAISLTLINCLFYITLLYKTQVTSDLIVPLEINPTKNVTTLTQQEGYAYIIDNSLHDIIFKFRAWGDRLLPKGSLLYRSMRKLLDFSEPTVGILRRKFIFLIFAKNSKVKIKIQILESMLGNMTCFIMDESLRKAWQSYTFVHQLCGKMKSFTKCLLESAIFKLLDTIDWNLKLNKVHSRKRGNDESLQKDKEEVC